MYRWEAKLERAAQTYENWVLEHIWAVMLAIAVGGLIVGALMAMATR